MNIKWSFLLLFVISISWNELQHSAIELTGNVAAKDTLFIPYHPLQNVQDLDLLIKEIRNSKIVLLGESTHGTREFYEWRAAITKRLVQEKGFDLIAVEGDWVDSYRVNRFIKGPQQDSFAVMNVLGQFDRWPRWMWGNQDMAPLIQWLNRYNQREENKKVAFYGLDLYSFWEWTEEDLPVDDKDLREAMKKLRDYFAPYKNDAMKYSADTRQGKKDGSQVAAEFAKAVHKVNGNKPPFTEAQLLLEEEALLAVDGERYFRTLPRDHVQALNIRDAHMAAVLGLLFKYHGPEAKAVIWVHNGHAGEGRYTNTGNNGYVNLGEILRREWGIAKIFSVGFGTYKGLVTAGYFWNGDPQVQLVPPAKAGSWEALLHSKNNENKLILSRELRDNPILNKCIEFRSIGATYSGGAIYNYSIMPKRFDAFIFIDSTRAIRQ
jgi:erythromycin esterase-like protein